MQIWSQYLRIPTRTYTRRGSERSSGRQHLEKLHPSNTSADAALHIRQSLVYARLLTKYTNIQSCKGPKN